MSVGLSVLAALAAAAALWRRRARRGRDRLRELLEGVARRSGARLAPSSTLSDLRAVLALVGPRTAALAAETERVRFAPDVPGPARHPRLRLARALAGDLGTGRALVLYVPAVKRRPRAQNRLRFKASSTSSGSSKAIAGSAVQNDRSR
jgi:hypothetical protein